MRNSVHKKVFISYFKKHSSFVNDLKAELRIRDVEAYTEPEESIGLGQNWIGAIVEFLTASSAIIIVASKDEDWSWPLFEVGLATDPNKDQQIPIIVLLPEDTPRTAIPSIFNDSLTIDTKLGGVSSVAESIVQAIGSSKGDFIE